MVTDYKHNKGSVVMLKYHLIWLPRRRKVLVQDVATRLEQLLREKCRKLQIEIRLKGYTSQCLRKSFGIFRRCLLLWTTIYFASTAGRVSEAMIRRYIEAQSTRAFRKA
jgi:putative transposase